MRNRYLQILFSLLVTFSFACNREKVNLEGRWDVVQVTPKTGNPDPNDSLNLVLQHFTVGNTLDFTAGELTVNRKGADDSTYYGFASYNVAKDGKSVLIDAGNYKPLTFQLKNEDNDHIALLHKRLKVKVLLKPYEEED